jgi:hypothetical protein
MMVFIPIPSTSATLTNPTTGCSLSTGPKITIDVATKILSKIKYATACAGLSVLVNRMNVLAVVDARILELFMGAYNKGFPLHSGIEGLGKWLDMHTSLRSSSQHSPLYVSRLPVMCVKFLKAHIDREISPKCNAP